MEKQKRWQLFLILAVIFLTVYNILPTVFYYSKPLKRPIEESQGQAVALDAAKRVNDLEQNSIDWLNSFCHLIEVKPVSIDFNTKEPQAISLSFKNASDADKFKRYFPRAGSLISFVPSQLYLYGGEKEEESKKVTVGRRIPVHLNEKQLTSFFQFSSKLDSKGNITPLYRALVSDRALQLAVSLGGPNENAQYLQLALRNPNDPQSQEILTMLAQNVLSLSRTFGESSPASERYFASFTQIETENKQALVNDFISALEHLKDQIKLERLSLQEESKAQQAQGLFLETVKKQRLELLVSREKVISDAENLVKKQAQKFAAGKTPWSYTSLGALLQESVQKGGLPSSIQTLSLDGRNPFINKILIDWEKEKIYLHIYPDILAFKEKGTQSYLRDQADRLLFNEIAALSRITGEAINPLNNQFEISLSQLQGSKSFLALRLGAIAETKASQVKQALLDSWHPKHPDLKKENFPIWDHETYLSLSPAEQKLGLVIYAPSTYNKMPLKGFRPSSIYVIAKGVDAILQKFQAAGNSVQAREFLQDFRDLQQILQQNGFLGYSGKSYGFGPEYSKDFIFEEEDYFQPVLKASREDFTVHGTKRYAVLEFTDVEQRILAINKIETRMHEDLLKWRDDYLAGQLGIKGVSPYEVPKPIKNVFWNNFTLSFAKYFRGDERKVLHWGLDLSGGKTVQIELRDTNNRVVTNENDLRQGINELYNRVNKMGVSEVSIRQEGNHITLDFPGSQGLSATELVKASSMYFHVVNEKFSSNHSALASAVQTFLQDVWNEAVVTNHKDVEEINRIAWRHLYGDAPNSGSVQPRSESAKTLYENGLRFANPEDVSVSNAFNDTFSKISLLRGADFSDWQGQTHPLLIVFHNFALEGSNLENVHASYDPSKGNFLSFGVKSSDSRNALYAWTSQFSKEKIMGTPNAAFSKDKGWRMAVVLNGSIISSPTLDSALRDSAMITGSFSQREVNQLEADLKAGSLSFTPHILSEKNVSPELGAHERTLGILAMVIALILVIAAMVSYYRFGGIVASVAVIFNLLIMWATFQNLQATLTLATIAGSILAVGMAVDANVLVFERIREEFALTGRIGSAISAGYRKAFSAIVDSNVTTLIATLILLNFDAGPIKGFAISLMIGIISSMFTALFMTRFFFAWWVKNPENKALKMNQFIKAAHFNFLKYTRPTVWLSALVILIGGSLLLVERHTILGMDFKGGYALSIELNSLSKENYRQEVETALIKQGASPQEFQVRELHPKNNIRIFLSRSMQQSGHPFYGMPLQTENKGLAYLYQNNPKIVWIVEALQKEGLSLHAESLPTLDQNWTEISGQMSDSMRNSALIGLALALFCILIYITVRFEFKYAISATLCLAHDMIFTLAAVGILYALGVPVQIDLNTIAALMTICGYSLNDTIIVFDRIREDVRTMRKHSFTEIINHALNVTLSRTVMTSGTTLLVLLPLVALGGSTIFGFALVMIIGVIFGTLSSLFIAAPLMLYFHNREVEKNQRLIPNEQ